MQVKLFMVNFVDVFFFLKNPLLLHYIFYKNLNFVTVTQLILSSLIILEVINIEVRITIVFGSLGSLIPEISIHNNRDKLL